METELLLQSIRNSSPNVDFEIDGIGLTWGVSYIRFVVGCKEKHQSIEHFFYSTVKSSKNMTSVQGGGAWAERVDLEKWVAGLKIEKVPAFDLIKFIDYSINEIIVNLHNWTTENTIDLSKLIIPKTFDDCWVVKETAYPRHYINSTETYLAITKDKHYCIEGHWES